MSSCYWKSDQDNTHHPLRASGYVSMATSFVQWPGTWFVNAFVWFYVCVHPMCFSIPMLMQTYFMRQAPWFDLGFLKYFTLSKFLLYPKFLLQDNFTVFSLYCLSSIKNLPSDSHSSAVTPKYYRLTLPQKHLYAIVFLCMSSNFVVL